MTTNLSIESLLLAEKRNFLGKIFKVYSGSRLVEEYKTYPKSNPGADCLKIEYGYSGLNNTTIKKSAVKWTQNMEDAFTDTDATFSNNTATEFDGINEYVDFGNTLDEFDVGQDWSMSFWINPDNTSAFRCFYSKCTNDVNVYGLNMQVSDQGKLFVQLRNANYGINYFGNINIVADQWTHVGVTYNGSGNFNGFKFYINGTQDTAAASTSIGSTAYPTDPTAILGSRNGSRYWSGLIDEVSMWDQELTSSEISELYNSGAPANLDNHTQIGSLIHWYRMGDGDTYPTILDSVGTVNGTMINMSEFSFVTL